jgi:hypothetical protein
VRSARQFLGVAPEADAPELTRAYWRQARLLHPDLSTDPEATEQFRALNAAYRLAVQAAPQARPSASSPAPAHGSPGEATPTSAGPPGRPVGSHGWITTAASQDSGVWVVAGPVHIREAARPDPREDPQEGRP